MRTEAKALRRAHRRAKAAERTQRELLTIACRLCPWHDAGLSWRRLKASARAHADQRHPKGGQV